VGRDDVSGLLAQASAFKGAAFAKSTVKTYKSQTTSYLKFCLHYQLQSVPASQDTLCAYLAFLSRSLSASSIKGYMNAVRLLHIEAGFINPLAQNWEITMIQRGISRLMGTPPKQKLPVTIPMLLALYSTLLDTPSDKAFWIACLIAFFGFLRKSTLLPASSELTLGKFIARNDVVSLTLQSFTVMIRFSKTIQFGQRVLSLPYVGCADFRLCPVRALLSHIGISPLPPSRPLFNYVQSGAEIHFSNAFFMLRLRTGLRATGYPASDISCHSFRRGGASLAYEVGLTATDIKQRGDWRSNAFEQYLTVGRSPTLQSARLLSRGAVSCMSCPR
jgi:hypothetical protein